MKNRLRVLRAERDWSRGELAGTRIEDIFRPD
jgi:DNA-binding XRE family transcriptional regulator